MSNVYRFVGSEALIGPLKLERFGTRVLMEDDAAYNAQLGGGAIILETDFKALGFTEEDLKIWADPFMDPFDVPGNTKDRESKAAFQLKRLQAQQIFCDLRQRLVAERHPEPLPEVSETLDSVAVEDKTEQPTEE